MAGIKDKTNQKEQGKYVSSYSDSGFGSDIESQMCANAAKCSDSGIVGNLIEGLWANIKGLEKIVSNLKTTVNLQARQIHELEMKGKDKQTHCHCSSETFETAPTKLNLPAPTQTVTNTSLPRPQDAVSMEVHSKYVPKAQKRLLFPKLEDSISFNQYVLNVSSCVEAFSDMGHDDGSIAQDLHQFLVQGELSSQFLHQLGKQKKKGLLSTADVILALKQCHLENALSSPWERFKNLRKLKKERLSGFLMRCEQYSQDVPFLIRNPEAQRWHIKMQFLRGARIPEKMHDRLLPYASLGEFLLACKRLLHQDRVYSNPVSKSEVVQGPWSRAGSAAPSFRHRSASQISTKVAKQHYINNSKSSILPSLLSFKPTMFTPLMANFQTFL